MAKQSRSKRAEARAKHQRQKHRAKYSRVVDHFTDVAKSTPYHSTNEQSMRLAVFHNMLVALNKLHVKYLITMLNDLKSSGYVGCWSGEYHMRLQISIETIIFERMVLK